jgi:hypothetical protein
MFPTRGTAPSTWLFATLGLTMGGHGARIVGAAAGRRSVARLCAGRCRRARSIYCRDVCRSVRHAVGEGFLGGKRYLILDRDAKYSPTSSLTLHLSPDWPTPDVAHVVDFYGGKGGTRTLEPSIMSAVLD